MKNVFFYLLEKEFLQIKRNAFLPRMIIIFPIMIMCVMPWVMNMEVKNIKAVVVDNDRSASSTRLVHQIEASRYFVFEGMSPSYEQALRMVERSEADIVVEIPPHFERDCVKGRRPQILIAANAVNGMKGTMGNQYMTSIVADNISSWVSAQGVKAIKADASSVLYLYNKHLNYKLFMIPSLIAVIMLLMCGFLPALNIVGEKEKGTIEAINVTPVSRLSFIMAKLVPYWVIALVVMTVCLLLAWGIYGITSAGNLGLIYLLAMLLAFVFSGFGLVISNYNSTMQQAVFVMWFFVVCHILLSGLFTPVRSMPHWAYLSTYVNPLHYFIDAVRTVFVRGGNFACIAHQVAALAIAAAIMNTWAVLSYRKNQ